MDKQELLKKMAIDKGLCQEWQNLWGNPTDQELIDKYIAGMDFVIMHDFPTLDFIKENFDKTLLNNNGIFCGGQIYGKHKTMVLNGDSHGAIYANKYDCIKIYARHNCNIEIYSSDFAFVTVFAHDNANIYIDNKGYRKVRVYSYSDNVVVDHFGDVMYKKRRFSDIYT